MADKMSKIKLACAPNVSLFKNWLTKHEKAERLHARALAKISGSLNKIVIGDTLPIIPISVNSEKLCEYKTKVLRYQNQKPTMVEYQYMGLYYNSTDKAYTELFYHRIIKIEEDSPREFNKKISVAEVDNYQINTNRMIGARAVYFIKVLIDKVESSEEAMHLKLSEAYDKHRAMIVALAKKAKVLADKKAAKALMLKLKADKKTIAMINSKGGDYTENCGMVL